jgi:hypothetical protein
VFHIPPKYCPEERTCPWIARTNRTTLTTVASIPHLRSSYAISDRRINQPLDVTDAVIDWLSSPSGNFGLAIVEAGLPNSAKVTFAAKEGPGSGPCAELEIELTGSANDGLYIAGDAGNAATVPFGTRYRDNSVVARARVTAAGTIDTNFNVTSVTKVGTGHYKINLGGAAQSGFSLITTATPEVDEAVGNVHRRDSPTFALP